MLETIMYDAMARSLVEYRAAPHRWIGEDWWQLSPEESSVFELAPDRWAELVPVWQAFEFFTGRTDGWNEADIERDYPGLDEIMQAARTRHSEWLVPEAGHQPDIFMQFARRFAHVRYREAMAMFAKMDFWAVRAGVFWFADEEG
jgi:hypothetical protein